MTGTRVALRLLVVSSAAPVGVVFSMVAVAVILFGGVMIMGFVLLVGIHAPVTDVSGMGFGDMEIREGEFVFVFDRLLLFISAVDHGFDVF